MGAFIHPLTDWGFKRIFGDKELLMDLFRELPDRQERDYRALLQGHRHDRQAYGQGVQQQVPSNLHRAAPLHEIGSRVQQFLRVLDL